VERTYHLGALAERRLDQVEKQSNNLTSQELVESRALEARRQPVFGTAKTNGVGAQI
jgi:hypothetical protein